MILGEKSSSPSLTTAYQFLSERVGQQSGQLFHRLRGIFTEAPSKRSAPVRTLRQFKEIYFRNSSDTLVPVNHQVKSSIQLFGFIAAHNLTNNNRQYLQQLFLGSKSQLYAESFADFNQTLITLDLPKILNVESKLTLFAYMLGISQAEMSHLKQFLEDFRDIVACRITRSIKADPAHMAGSQDTPEILKLFLESEKYYYTTHSRVGNTNADLTFILNQPPGSEKQSDAIELFIRTWEKFTSSPRHVAGISFSHPKQVTVLLIDAPANLQMRSFAEMSEQNPIAVIRLTDTYQEVVIHEAIHAAIGAYTGAHRSFDFIEGCATRFGDMWTEQFLRRSSVRNRPRPKELLALKDFLLSEELDPESSTQIVKTVASNRVISEQEIKRYFDKMQYLFGYILVEVLIQSRHFNELCTRLEDLNINAIESILLLNTYFVGAQRELRRRREPILQRTLLKEVITNPRFLGWGEVAYHEIIIAIREYLINQENFSEENPDVVSE